MHSLNFKKKPGLRPSWSVYVRRFLKYANESLGAHWSWSTVMVKVFKRRRKLNCNLCSNWRQTGADGPHAPHVNEAKYGNEKKLAIYMHAASVGPEKKNERKVVKRQFTF